MANQGSSTPLLPMALATLCALLPFLADDAAAFVSCCGKWDEPTFGTGATVTWSFMTPGAAASPSLNFLGGTNSLGTGNANDIRRIIDIDQGNGVGAFNAAVRRAFATWSAAANIRFVEVADSGAAFGQFAPGSTQPDIRIGAYTFLFNGVPTAGNGGAGFGPPGNDLSFPDPLAGDLALNDFNKFVIAPGAEGAALPTGPGGLYLNDIEGLLVHEIGHTLGLAHSNVVNGVMCGFQAVAPGFDGSLCDFTHINRRLEPDDLAGIRSIYGAAVATATPTKVPVAPAWALWLMGMVLAGLAWRRAGE